MSRYSLGSVTGLFLFLVFMGSVVSLSSPYWLVVWCGMELGHLSLLPLLKGESISKESVVQYYSVQALGSMLLLLGMSMNFCPGSTQSYISYTASVLGLIVKLGGFPAHFWVPKVVSGLDWISNLIVLTWQKVVPLFILVSFLGSLVSWVAAGSSLVGAFGGLNQTITKAIVAYSSITHTGWLMFSLMVGELELVIYFMIYMLLSSMLLFTFNKLEKPGPAHSSVHPLSVVVPILATAGLPPFLGFVGKWWALKGALIWGLSISGGIFLSLMLLGSLVALVYYVKLSFNFYLLEEKDFDDKMDLLSSGFVLVNILGFGIFLFMFFLAEVMGVSL